MIPELGQFALIIALCLALVQGVMPLAGAQTRNRAWMAIGKPAAAGQFVFVLLSFLVLTWAFIQNDFSVTYVASHSNSALPLMYRISAVWGAHEGSLLLWILVLNIWIISAIIGGRHLPEIFNARVVGVLGLVSVGFLAFILFTSNPFDRLIPAAMDGRDLNPLLQDPALAIHPPMLYFGYVGFAVPFAFAIAVLLEGRQGTDWARWAKPWATMSWVCLTLGIALGSWWAYYELGWGGWWFWDPVENASFMPWLMGTALIHSLSVTEKRGLFKSWTLLLAISAFSLSLLGTFLVRSGVLVSVHAFASDPERGLFILIFLCVVVGAALTLYAWRAPRMTSDAGFAAFSRESFLLANNILLVIATFVVLIGTLFPLVMDALGQGKYSVGPQYFAAVFIIPTLPMVLVAGYRHAHRVEARQVEPGQPPCSNRRSTCAGTRNRYFIARLGRWRSVVGDRCFRCVVGDDCVAGRSTGVSAQGSIASHATRVVGHEHRPFRSRRIYPRCGCHRNLQRRARRGVESRRVHVGGPVRIPL